jgi:hypothetical protein
LDADASRATAGAKTRNIPIFLFFRALPVGASTSRMANLFFREPLEPGQPPSVDAVDTSPQTLKKPIQPAIPYLPSVSQKIFNGADRKCFGCSPYECRRTGHDIVNNRITVVPKQS